MKFIKLLGLITLQVFTLSTFAQAKSDSKILFIRHAGQNFLNLFQLMKKELKNSHKIEDYVISKDTSFESFRDKINIEKPQLLVLLDNQPTQFAINYNKTSPTLSGKINAVALMGLNLRFVLKDSLEIAGISFESPAYNLVTQFRFIIEQPIRTVLVFYRASLFSEEIELTRKQLLAEGIKLEAINVEQNGLEKENIFYFLKTRLKSETGNASKYDMVWVMLDSGILNNALFQNVWLPAARESQLPFLTGIEDFVSNDMNFATFAVTPNIPDLANQAVQMIESILSGVVAPKDIGVENLISVDKVLNIKKAQTLGIKLKTDRITEIKLIK